jgi:CheY-like chemotaxis protein
LNPILVVAGAKACRQRLVQVLVHAGYHVVEAETGRTALSIAEHSAPKLILIAIVMPDIGGLEIAAQLQENFGREAPPIILLGALPPIGLNDEPLASLVSGYLNMDVSPVELLATVQSQLVLSSS